MYSRVKVTQKLDFFATRNGWRPSPHTIDDVIGFERYLHDQGLYHRDPDSNAITSMEKVPDDVARWIQNEILLCLCDAEYYLTRYAYLKNQEGVIQRFQFRVPQRIYFDIIADLEERDLAIEFLILKARQLGMSIMTELLTTQRIVFSYGVNAVIGSADSQKTYEMSQMMFLAYDSLPFWMKPKYTARVESERGKLIFGQQSSGVTFQHGSQKHGIGTGTTPTVYHLSEVALYGDLAVKLIDEGLWKAVHASPGVFGVLESTGRSNLGWWANTWYYSKANYPKCRMYPMFLPWYCGTDIYPTPTFLRARPIPPTWQPREATRKHANKAGLYVASTPLLRKHLLAEQVRRNVRRADDPAPWVMPREQQWFWEINHEEAKTKGIEASYLQEMAGDDDEALQRASESVFGNETIELVTREVKPDFETYTIAGHGIEADHEVPAEYHDYTREIQPVRYMNVKGERFRWNLIPLKTVELRHDHPEDVDGVLLIWHHPRPGALYAMGGDTSGGKGSDSTCIQIFEMGFGEHPDIQCAEFAGSWVNHTQAWAFLIAIGGYYAAPMLPDYLEGTQLRPWKEPYTSIEQVEAVGDTAQKQMALCGWSNFHRMPHYDNLPQRIRKEKRSRSTKVGWYTRGFTRPLLVGDFVQNARNRWVQLNSPWLINEMKHFEVHETSTGKEKMEHEEDQHDDRIFGAALATFPPHDLDKSAERTKKRLAERTVLPPVDIAPLPTGVTVSTLVQPASSISLHSMLYNQPDLDRYRDG